MIKLSTGADSTLGSYLDLTNSLFGKDSKQAKFLNDKIASSKQGRDEEVITAETQMLNLLGSMGD